MKVCSGKTPAYMILKNNQKIIEKQNSKKSKAQSGIPILDSKALS